MRNFSRFIPLSVRHTVRRRLPPRLCRALDRHVCLYAPACPYQTKAERESLARLLANMRANGLL